MTMAMEKFCEIPTTKDRLRDKREQELADEANKRELLSFMRHGLEVAVYWLKKTDEVSMSLTEDNHTREFLVPGDKVMDATDHPEYYANQAGLPRPSKRWFEVNE